MNWDTVESLATVLFKSYFRASRPGRRSFFSSPKSFAVIDLLAFAPAYVFFSWVVSIVPVELESLVDSITVSGIVSFPLILTSAVIFAGILFELGTVSGLGSSEAVNWLPLSPREYVVASCLSLDFAYSPLLALGLGIMFPLAVGMGYASVLPSLLVLSLVAVFLGAVVVEILRSVMNRISNEVYTRNRKLSSIGRIVAVVVLISAMDLAFQGQNMMFLLNAIVNGVSLAWFVPVVWPSVALVALLSSEPLKGYAFLGLSLAFAVSLFYLSAYLREKYWSPAPVTVEVASSPVYVPQGRSFLWLDQTAFALAMKDFRSLVRRREMARFLAIPVVVAVIFVADSLSGAYGSDGIVVMLISLSTLSTILPIMLSSISIGQEGRSIANIYMLPITPTELGRGKLLFPVVISGLSVGAVLALLQALIPVPPGQLLIMSVALAFIILIQSYFGLGSGTRFPDFTLGPRARFMTGTGFFVTFVGGFVATLAVLAPFMFYLISPYLASLGLGEWGTVGLVVALTAGVGTVLLALSWLYCSSGLRRFLSDMEF